jgi:hypothetical protein
MKQYILLLCLLWMLSNVYAQLSIPKSVLPKTLQPQKEKAKWKPQAFNTAEQRKRYWKAVVPRDQYRLEILQMEL